MDISIIILNLNTREFLRDCLQSIVFSGLSDGRFEVVVSDNGSSDKSVEMVRNEFPWAKVITNGKNLGFAAGNNAALPYISVDTRYILFLNSDTKVPAGTLPEMIKFMDGHPDVGASTCYIEMRDGSMDMNSHRGFPTPLTSLFYFSGLYKRFPKSKLFGGYYQTYKDLASTHEIDSLEGAFMLVRRTAGSQAAIGPNEWWDNDFFFFGEDLDFCFRLRERGWKIMYHPKVKIWHYKGATHGFNGQGVVQLSKEERVKLIKSTTDAMKLFYQKHYEEKYNPVITSFVFVAIDLLATARSRKGGI
jgi:GT2 family glycosyltransferase